MPQHPTTWFKIQFENGEIATFRSSALIPLDGLGNHLPGFGMENNLAAASKRKVKLSTSQYDHGGIEMHSGDNMDSEITVPARRALREHSGFQIYTLDSEIASLGSSTQRPRTTNSGRHGRSINTGFRQYDNESNNPRFSTKTTEAERRAFNDFVEVAHASAYVPGLCQEHTRLWFIGTSFSIF